MASSNVDPATMQFAGLLAESISTYDALSEQKEYSPELLQQFEHYLEAGADPNVVLFAYPLDDNIIIYALDPAEPKGTHSQGTYVCDALRRQNSMSFRCAAHDIPWIRVQCTRCEVPLAVAAKRKDSKMLALLTRYGASYKVINQLPPKRRFFLRNPFQLLLHELDEVLLRQLLATTEPNIPLVERWLEVCLINVLEDSTGGDEASRLRIATLLAHHGGVLSPSEERVMFVAADFLIKHNITRNEDGFTALHMAAGRGASALCNWLLNRWLDPNATDTLGITPLHEAVQTGDADTVRILLQYGANPNLTCGSNQTEKSQLHMTDCPELARALYYRTNDSATLMSNMHWSALHVAAHRGDQIIVQMLIEAGADGAIKDNNGDTALQIALQYECTYAAFKLFKSYGSVGMGSEAATRLMVLAIKSRSSDIVPDLVRRGVPAPSFIAPDKMDWFYAVSRGTTKEHGPPEAHPDHTKEARTDSPAAAPSMCPKCVKALEGKVIASSSEEPSTLCNLCRLIYDSAQHQSGTITHVEYVKEASSPDILLKTRTAAGTKSHPVRVVTRDWHTFLRDCSSLEDDSTGSSAAVAMTKKWVQTCTQSHSQCKSRGAEQHSPRRILDLSNADTQHVRLLQDEVLNEPYVALSHRWGTESLPRTIVANLDTRLIGISTDELTKTMQDAIYMTRALGYNYLWIDALCIVQDSEEDWRREASRMSDVFRGAVVTIAVADAKNHSQGMFRSRLGYCHRPFYLPASLVRHQDNRKPIHFSPGDELYVFPSTGLVSSDTRPKGTLDTRGWILQEQLLSARIVYFGHGEVFWDCMTVSASESSPISASLLFDLNPDETWALKILRKVLAGSMEPGVLRQRLADVWTQIIMNYSSRQLSKDSDKLIALDGIIRPLSTIVRDSHVAGMWRAQLWRQLIWWTTQPAADSARSTEPQFSAPSWSWLSIGRPVAYHDSLADDGPIPGKSTSGSQSVTSRNFTDLEEHIKIISVDTTSAAHGLRGSLEVSGPSFRYRLTKNDLKKPVFKRWNAAKLNLNPGKWLLDCAIGLPLELHCVIIAEDTAKKMLICMCLVPDEFQSGSWRRVGLCHWEGLMWQVGKFVRKEPEEMVFKIV